jgi:hypothetical protein
MVRGDFHQFIADSDACGEMLSRRFEGSLDRVRQLATDAFISDVRDRLTDCRNGRDIRNGAMPGVRPGRGPPYNLAVDRNAQLMPIRKSYEYAITHDNPRVQIFAKYMSFDRLQSYKILPLHQGLLTGFKSLQPIYYLLRKSNSILCPCATR